MLTADPEIARPGHRVRRRLWRLVSVFTILRRTIEQAIEFVFVEAEHSEVDVLIPEGSKFRCQHLVIPAGVLGDAIVGDHQSPALRRRQVRQHDHRRFREAKLARRKHAAVTRDDHAIIADQHWVHEPELGDRSCDLRDLILGMRARVAGVRDQSVERPMLNRYGAAEFIDLRM